MGATVYSAPTWNTLVGALAERWRRDPLPPFQFETVIVSAPGVARILSQELAGAIGAGICAGAKFQTMSEFRLELDPPEGADPWRRRALSLAIVDALPTLLERPAFALLSHHLGERNDPTRPGRWFGFARRFASTLASYATEQPGMLRAWSAGQAVDSRGEALGEAEWQYLLWRALAERAPTPDPVSRHDRLLSRLERMTLPDRLQVFAPQPLPVLDAELLRALATGPGLDCYVVGDQRLPWLDEAEPVRVPGHAQPPAMSVHSCHGPHRQVEVLREVLCGIFDADPSLEPRDVVVYCADLARYAPLIKAAFAPLALEGAHPGRQLRAGVAEAALQRNNDVALTLSTLLALPDSRARLNDLLALCSLPPVARRFGFSAEAIARFGELLASAGVRWGIDAAHRARFGLGVTQNTWLSGLDRLLAGLVLPEDEATWIGTLTPSETVGSSDADQLGQLAEMISRVRWFTHVTATPLTMSQWTQVLREALDRFVATEPDSAWALHHVLGQLASLEDQTEGSEVTISRAEMSSLLPHLVPERAGRPNYGNGSLLVTSLGDLADVGFRVVCLLGLEEAAGAAVLGDRLEPVTDLSAEALRRHRFWRAASAAKDQVIVVYQGTNERTGEALPKPVALQRLVDDAAAAGWQAPRPFTHTLHAHDPRNFDPAGPFSFDSGLARARLSRIPRPHPARPGPAAPEQAELSELVRFIAHPASYYLSHRLGLVDSGPPPRSAGLPIQLSGLERWAIGDRMLRRASQGETLEALMQAEWRRGTVGPGEFGRSALESVASRVDAILEVAGTFEGPPSEHEIEVEAGGVRVIGRVRARGALISEITFSKTDDRAWVDLWWRVVAASAAGLDLRGGVVVGSPDYSRDVPARVTSRFIPALPRQEALALLEGLVGTYLSGLVSVVPLPRGPARDLAGSLRLRRQPPDQKRVLEILERGWRYGTDPSWHRFFPTPLALVSVPGASEASRFVELSRLLYLPMIHATQVSPHV